MEFLNKYNLSGKNILKFAALALIALVVLSFGFQLVGTTFSRTHSLSQSIMGQTAYDFDNSMAMESAGGYATKSVDLSLRNVSPTPAYDGGTTGSDAEDYEVTEYNARIETRDLAGTCAQVAELKAKDYVIFENANQADTYCNYTFKVKTDKAEEILAIIKELDPKDLDENTRTIKKLVEDYTSELEILNNKKYTIESTLSDAINSYDEIARVATRANDAESLAKIIDSKVRIIEKLSQERININAQIDRLSRSKAEQLDRLEYTYFYVNIYENKYVDFENIRDSWKRAVKNFVNDVNSIAQNVSINLITMILVILQYILYLIIILLIGKVVWNIGKRIWKKQG